MISRAAFVVMIAVVAAGAMAAEAVDGGKPAAGNAEALPEVVLNGKAKEFDAWIAAIWRKRPMSREDAALAERAVRARLEAERYTSDFAIKAALGAWVTYCEQAPKADPEKRDSANRYGEVVRRVDAMLPLLESIDGRTALRGELSVLKRVFLRNDGLEEAAARADEETLRILRPLQLAVDKNMIQASVSLGDALQLRGKNEEAEKHFLVAARYRWYLVEDVFIRGSLKAEYVRAMMGLMRCWRGNRQELERLRGIYVPAAGRELKDEIESLIQETAR